VPRIRDWVTVVAIVVGASLVLGAVTNPPLQLMARAQQTSKARPRFDIVALKVNPAGPSRGLLGRQLQFMAGGRFTVTGITLRQLVLLAYRGEIMGSELSGGPEWWVREAYDINAHADEQAFVGATTSHDRSTLLESMMQSLLDDRFHLRFRRERVEANIWTLAVVKSGGEKLARAKNTGCRLDDSPGSHCHAISGGVSQGLDGESITAGDIARFLQEAVLVERVVDGTGLVGMFDVRVKWTGNAFLARQDPNGPNSDEAQNGDGSDVFTALREQAGLRLVRQKAPVTRLVVEGVDHPTTE
jgi:uncharacterized protein (TIGR03435 family)